MTPAEQEVQARLREFDGLMGEPHDPPRCINCGGVHAGISPQCWTCRTQLEMERRGLFGDGR